MQPAEHAPQDHTQRPATARRRHDGMPDFARAIIDTLRPFDVSYDFVAALRAISSVGGLNARCPIAQCRHTGACKAAEISEHASPCLAFWTPPQRIAFNAAVAALAQAHIRTRRHIEAVHAAITQWEADNPDGQA